MSDEKVDKEYEAIFIENEYIKEMCIRDRDTGISVKHFVPEYKLALLIGRFGGNVIF